MFPAHFVHCPDCGRLITVDALNPTGRCTTDCILTALVREAEEMGLYEATAEPKPTR